MTTRTCGPKTYRQVMDIFDRPADAIAPDGSEVRLLARGVNGSMAHFRLAAHNVSKAIEHRQVEELWCFTAGEGEMCVGDEVHTVNPGASLTIPPRTRFQFRSTGDGPLEAIGVTMPPWPGDSEAEPADPYWV